MTTRPRQANTGKTQLPIGSPQTSKKTKTRIQTEFKVPNWMDASHPRLAMDGDDDEGVNEEDSEYSDNTSQSRDTPYGDNDTLIPKASSYDFYDVFGKRGEFASTTKKTADGNAFVSSLSSTMVEEFMALEQQKNLASMRLAEMVGGYDDIETTKQFAEAEYDVTRRRIALLQKCLMEGGDHALCHEFQAPEPDKQKISVQYRMFSMEDNANKHEIQSPVSWAAKMNWRALHTLLNNDPQTSTHDSRALLEILHNSCPKKESTKDLALLLKDYDKKDFEPTNKLYALGGKYDEAPQSTVIFGWTYNHTPEDDDDYPITISTGILSVNTCELWHNPETNKIIQQAILNSGAVTLKQNAARNGHNPVLTNIIQVNVTIQDVATGVNHVLSLAPFYTPDSCTASFMAYSQDIPDPDAEEEDQESLGILKTRATNWNALRDVEHVETKIFSCLGAHRNVRLNEHHLANIHGQAIHNYEKHDVSKTFEDIDTEHLEFDQDTMPAAKVARVSFNEWDVLISSYKHENRVYTHLTAVNYPPYGTQFESRHTGTEWPRLPQNSAHHQHYHAPQKTREVRHDWKKELDLKEQYYVPDAVLVMPAKKIILTFYEQDPDLPFSRQYQDTTIAIRDTFWEEYKTIWDPTKGFAANIRDNPRVNESTGNTIGQEWRFSWRREISADIALWNTAMPDELELWPGYWYCEHPIAWRQILKDHATADKYARLSKELHDRQVAAKIFLKEGPQDKARKDSGMIRNPRALLANKTTSTSAEIKPEITKMQARIQALEAKLDQSRQEANNAHLLQKVLSKLEDGRRY